MHQKVFHEYGDRESAFNGNRDCFPCLSQIPDLKEPIRPCAVKVAQIFESCPSDVSRHSFAQTELLLKAILILLKTKLIPVPYSIWSRVPALSQGSINENQRFIDEAKARLACKSKYEVLILGIAQFWVKASNALSKIRLRDQGLHPNGTCWRMVQQ